MLLQRYGNEITRLKILEDRLLELEQSKGCVSITLNSFQIDANLVTVIVRWTALCVKLAGPLQIV